MGGYSGRWRLDLASRYAGIGLVDRLTRMLVPMPDSALTEGAVNTLAAQDPRTSHGYMEDVVASKYPDIVEITSVEPLAGFATRVTFTDGSQRVIDLEPYLFGPVFEPIRSDPAVFRRVFVDHGALTWPNGAEAKNNTAFIK